MKRKELKDLDRAATLHWTRNGRDWGGRLIEASEFNKEVEELGLTTQQQKESVFMQSWDSFLKSVKEDCESEEDVEYVIEQMINGGYIYE